LEKLRNFRFHIPWDEYATIMPTKSGEKLVLQDNWTNVFYKHFKSKNPVCNLQFHRHRVNKPPVRANSSFIYAEGRCSRELCTAFYYCKVTEVPKKENDVTVYVRYVT
jgi:hypothetical protein